MDKLTQDYKLQGIKLNIHTYPDPVLTKVAEDVTEFNDELRTLCQNMLFTMYQAPGIGLAAPQVGVSKRIFVMDIDYERKPIDEEETEFILSEFNPYIFINPKFYDAEGSTTYQEGCLSLPGIYEDIVRAQTIKVDFKDTQGNDHTISLDGLHSICAQHENDHLDGIVMLDRMSNLKKNFFKKKLIKNKKKQHTL